MDCLAWLKRCVENTKTNYYDSDSGSGLQLHNRSSPGERNGKLSQNGKSAHSGKVHLGLNVSSSTHDCGCVVNGSGTMAYEYYYYYHYYHYK